MESLRKRISERLILMTNSENDAVNRMKIDFFTYGMVELCIAVLKGQTPYSLSEVQKQVGEWSAFIR